MCWLVFFNLFVACPEFMWGRLYSAVTVVNFDMNFWLAWPEKWRGYPYAALSELQMSNKANGKSSRSWQKNLFLSRMNMSNDWSAYEKPWLRMYLSILYLNLQCSSELYQLPAFSFFYFFQFLCQLISMALLAEITNNKQQITFTWAHWTNAFHTPMQSDFQLFLPAKVGNNNAFPACQ